MTKSGNLLLAVALRLYPRLAQLDQARQTSGDFYDFITLGEGRLGSSTRSEQFATVLYAVLDTMTGILAYSHDGDQMTC